jgi:hypothetical protein
MPPSLADLSLPVEQPRTIADGTAAGQVKPAASRRRPPSLTLQIGAGVARFRTVKAVDGWHAEGRRVDASRAPWRRLREASPNPYLCLGRAVGRVLSWEVAQRDVDSAGALDFRVRVDGLPGTLWVAIRAVGKGEAGWRAAAAPARQDEAWWEPPMLADRWSATGGGIAMATGRDPAECATLAVARAVARLYRVPLRRPVDGRSATDGSAVAA